jgi:hypothetical protein
MSAAAIVNRPNYKLRKKQALGLTSDRAKAQRGFIAERTARIIKDGHDPEAARPSNANALACCFLLVLPFDAEDMRGFSSPTSWPTPIASSVLRSPIRSKASRRRMQRVMQRPDGSVWIHSQARAHRL